MHFSYFFIFKDKLQYIETLCCFSIVFLTFFPAMLSLYLFMYIDIYVVFISSIADDKYHGYQSLAGICRQVRSQLASCKQSTIIALGRLPPADQVTETALMAFRSLLKMFALALVSLCICSCPNNPNHTRISGSYSTLYYPAGKYVLLHVFDLK